ncbi:hypothetical protein CPJ18_02120 [Agrobacterium rosae]|uniref:Uncharacterized protein n=1 Tax=Agrobacterium rosae TaxID=1972867 RepID=A0AAE5S1H1_9HYPH|nr:hypothetical protein CPJ18_02120 [Agrobacterium rosae]
MFVEVKLLKEDRGFWVRWSLCAAMMRTRLPQTASLLSVLAYTIVLSDKYTELADGLNAPTGMVVAAQLKSMFMGGFVTLLAMGMYWLLCPRPIKNFRDRRDYVDYVVRGLDPDELNIALETLSDIPPDAVVQLSDLRVKIADLTNAKEEGIATPVLISDYYTFVDRRGMRAPMFCFSMLSIGAMLFLLPAAISVITALPSAMEIFDDRGQSFGLP